MVSTSVHRKDIYRLFLQAAMSRRIMSETVAKRVWQKCTEVIANASPDKDIQFVDGQREWESFLEKIGTMLDPFHLEFKNVVDEMSGVRMYAIGQFLFYAKINTKADEAAQVATDFTASEIAFFKAVVEQIILAPNYSFSVSSLAALREISYLKSSMTKAQGEIILSSLVARNWLVKSKLGRYSLGTRTILELGAYLKDIYDESDLLECTICFDLVTKGLRCARPNCKATLHFHCHEKTRRRTVCPVCQQPWGEAGEGILPVGEKAARHGQDRDRRTRRSQEDAEEEEDSGYTQTQSVTQPQAQSVSQNQSQPSSKERVARGSTVRSSRGKQRAAPQESSDSPDDMYADDTMVVDTQTQ